MAARRTATWADIPEMAPPPQDTDRELPALAAVVAILGQLYGEERGRVLRYVVERYGPAVRFGDGSEP